MPISVAIKAHLARTATYLAKLWRVEERPREILVNWATSSRVSVSARGGYLKKTGTTSDPDAGAFASHPLKADGYLKFIARLNGTIYCGLSTTNDGATAAGIDFAIRVDADGTVKVYESNTLKHTGTDAARKGDWFFVKRVDGAIGYWHNRTLLYTSEETETDDLFADASIATPNATIDGACYGTIPLVIAVTDHTRRLTWQGEVYQPLPMLPSQFVLNAGFKPDNLEVMHVLSSEAFTEPDLIGGRWDLARVEFTVVNYLDLSQGHARRKVGYLGQVKINNGTFTAEIRGLSQLMSQELGEVIGKLCTARRLGNFECGLDITNFMHDGAVVSVDGLEVELDLDPAKADDYFAYGLLYFRDGQNKHYEREVKSSVGNTLTLYRPFPFLPEVGDLVTAIVGCARTLAACKAFPSEDTPSGTQVENYQGFPHVPTLEKTLRYPDA